MGPRVIVVVHEVLKARLSVFEILRLYSLPKLFFNRFPESLALAHRLRVMASRHDMLDALFAEHPFELRFSSPCKVLAPLIRQYFLRLPKALDATE